MLFRIGQVVHDHLLHTLRVALNRIGIVHICRHVHIHTIWTTVFHSTDGFSAHIIHIANPDIHAILSALHIRDVKDIIHQRAQQIRIALDDDTIL